MTNFQKDYEKAKRRVSKNDIKYSKITRIVNQETFPKFTNISNTLNRSF